VSPDWSPASCMGRRTASGLGNIARAHPPRLKHLVPDAVGPTIELAIPHNPLLLRAVDDGATVELNIGHEAAACVRRTGAVIHKGGEAVHADPAHRRGLRHRPEFAAVAAKAGVFTLMVRFDNDRQKFTSAMQLPGPKHWLRT